MNELSNGWSEVLEDNQWMNSDLPSVGLSYTGKISAFPDNRSTLPKKGLEITHSDHRIEEEADEVGKGKMRDTV